MPAAQEIAAFVEYLRARASQLGPAAPDPRDRSIFAESDRYTRACRVFAVEFVISIRLPHLVVYLNRALSWLSRRRPSWVSTAPRGNGGKPGPSGHHCCGRGRRYCTGGYGPRPNRPRTR